MSVGLVVSVMVGGLILYLSRDLSAILMIIFSWIFIIPSIWLCVNELLFKLPWKFKIKKLFSLKVWTINANVRIIDLVSLAISLGACFWWWQSSKNWIVSDFIFVAIFFACVKTFKFQSLQQAVFAFSAAIILEITFVVIGISMLKNSVDSVNSIVLNELNSPLLFQVPTINRVYNEKCSWLSVTSIVFPSALISFLRRFDKSKNTKYVYFITCIIVFCIGSLILIILIFFVHNRIPFGLIPEPIMIGFIFLWSWKRK
jgi:hypothetical protein